MFGSKHEQSERLALLSGALVSHGAARRFRLAAEWLCLYAKPTARVFALARFLFQGNFFEKKDFHVKCCKWTSIYAFVSQIKVLYCSVASVKFPARSFLPTPPPPRKRSKCTMNYESLAVKQLFKLSTDLFNQWKTEPTIHELAACRYVWMLITSVFRKREKQLH